MNEGTIDAAVDAMAERIAEAGDDDTVFTLAEALAFYEGVLGYVQTRVTALRDDLRRNA